MDDPLSEFRFRLSAGRVDPSAGIIYGVTIAKANVPAAGKFVFVDAQNQVTKDPDKARRKLPVMTDDQTLASLMAAYQDAGLRVKSRVDHNDSIEARAGFCDNPQRIGDRVIADLHLNQSFIERPIVLEVASTTPELIGMSLDMIPDFEIKGEVALMRIKELAAVDIVDEGAITPAGLFLNRSRVDTADPSGNTPSNPVPPPPMADKEKNPPQSDETAAALKTLTGRCDMMDSRHAQLEAGMKNLGDGLKSLESKHAALQAAHDTLAGVTKAPPAKGDGDGGEPDGDEMKSGMKEVRDGLRALRAEFVELKKTGAALGLKAGGQPGTGGPGTGPSADPNDPSNRGGDQKAKDYLTLVKEARGADSKLSASAAHAKVQRENPEAYRMHQERKGVWKAAAA